MSKIKKLFLNPGSSMAYAVITAIFTIVPEEYFKLFCINPKWQVATTVLVNRVIICVGIFALGNAGNALYRKKRKSVTVSGRDYTIQVEYGDLFACSAGRIIVDFDECFTTDVGDAPHQIKPDSVCGQYLKKHPINNMQELIDKSGVKPARTKSQYNNQIRYESGSLVPNGSFLLMAFAKLDKNGLGHLSYDEYIECLNKLWEQIDIYHGTSDVYMPILGSKITRFDKELTQQELLDIIISTYRLSPKKMKEAYKLHIMCKAREGFSLNDVFGID